MALRLVKEVVNGPGKTPTSNQGLDSSTEYIYTLILHPATLPSTHYTIKTPKINHDAALLSIIAIMAAIGLAQAAAVFPGGTAKAARPTPVLAARQTPRQPSRPSPCASPTGPDLKSGLDTTAILAMALASSSNL